MALTSERSFAQSFTDTGGAHMSEGRGASILELCADNRGTEDTRLYERSWNLSFLSNMEGVDPEADFLVFHFEQRKVSFTFTLIVVVVTAVSAATRTNVQSHWLLGMCCAWFIWGGCLIAMLKLYFDRKALESKRTTTTNTTTGDDIGAGVTNGDASVEITVNNLLASPTAHRKQRSSSSEVSEPRTPVKSRKAAESELPILHRTAALQDNAAYWESVMVMSCVASLCFSISLYLGKQNCIKGDDVSPEAVLDTCTGSVQFDAAFVVIYTGAAILLNIRVKIFAPILLCMNGAFFSIRSIEQIPGVPTFVSEIVISYALVSLVQTCLCVAVVYVRESASRDYFETSQRLQFHTLRLSKLRNETERDIEKFCPPDAALGVTEGHGLFRITDAAVVCVFSMSGLASWNSLRCPIDCIEATNRFVEVLDGLRIVFDFKPTKYDTVGDLYVVMDVLHGASSSTTQQNDNANVVVQSMFGFALLAVAECNLKLIPLLNRDAFLPPGGCGGEMTHAGCVESRASNVVPLRLFAAVDSGRSACMYSPHTENIVVVGECYERALKSLTLCSLCDVKAVSGAVFHSSTSSQRDVDVHLDAHVQSCMVARSLVVGESACRILCATIKGASRSRLSTSTSTDMAAHQPNASGEFHARAPRGVGHPSAATTTRVQHHEQPGLTNPLRALSSSSGYVPSEPAADMHGVPLVWSPCSRFLFADLSASHTTWINLISKARRDSKPMRHDRLSTDFHLHWLLVLLADNMTHSTVAGGAQQLSVTLSSHGSSSNLTVSKNERSHPQLQTPTGGGGAPMTVIDEQRMEDSKSHGMHASRSTTKGGEGRVDDAPTGRRDAPVTNTATYEGGAASVTSTTGPTTHEGDIEFRMIPTFTFLTADIEDEYQLWSRGPLQLNLLLVSFAGCTAASIILVCICALYGVTNVDRQFDSPMTWAVVSCVCGSIGLGWSFLRWCQLRSRLEHQPSTIIGASTVGSPAERAILSLLYHALAVCYCATIFVSPQGSSALGNGQLLWYYALFGVSMSRPQWYGPLTMWFLDVLVALAFLTIWSLFPYRTADIRTTHVFLISAGAVYSVCVRYVMENAKRSAFVTELNVWILQEKLNDEYDAMQAALKHIAPRFVGDEIVQALRQHHICHPDAYGVMCVVLPQLAICAVLELQAVPISGAAAAAAGCDWATLKRLGLAINSILAYVRDIGGDCISPLRVDGTRIVLCAGVAKKDRREHEESLFRVERTHAERAHQFVRCCHDLVFRVIPRFTQDRAVHVRCFLTSGPLLGGVIGTGRISFNFFGPRIATALHAFPETPWNGADHVVVSRSLVMMQSAVELEARRAARGSEEHVLTPTERFQSNHTSRDGSTPSMVPGMDSTSNGTASSNNNGKVTCPNSTTTSRKHSGGAQHSRNAAGEVAPPSASLPTGPHNIEFSEPTSLRVRGFPPIEVQFALAPPARWVSGQTK